MHGICLSFIQFLEKLEWEVAEFGYVWSTVAGHCLGTSIPRVLDDLFVF